MREKECGSEKVELIRDLNLLFFSGVGRIHSRPALFAKNVDLKLQSESQGSNGVQLDQIFEPSLRPRCHKKYHAGVCNPHRAELEQLAER